MPVFRYMGSMVDGLVVRPQRVLVPDGSVSEPPISFQDDEDTGFRRASGALRSVVSGADEIVVAGSGVTFYDEVNFNARRRDLPESDKTANYQMAADDTVIPVDTLTVGAFTVTLVVGADGQLVRIPDIAGNCGVAALTIAGSGVTIRGATSLNAAYGMITALYDAGNTQWICFLG